ncbi:hypothetical protein KKB83_04495 [Patescibacteria group bacterium]|nr:hypothetical protein [Patescibacteria group bacterium]
MQEKFTPKEVLTHIPERYRHDPYLYDRERGALNIGSSVEEPNLAKLSNFPNTPFVLDGIEYASVEGFIQGLKFWNEEDQMRAADTAGYEAKKESHRKLPTDEKPRSTKGLIRVGFSAEENEERVGYVTNYQGIAIPYRSSEHYDLIARAIRAKFVQNSDCRKALLQTGRCELTHDLGHPESSTTSLPAEVFTTILMRIRQEYLMEDLAAQAQKGDITHNLYRFYGGDMKNDNPYFLKIQKLGYRHEAINWLKSLTPEGMRFGTASGEERLGQAQKYANLADITDLETLAKEAELTEPKN